MYYRLKRQRMGKQLRVRPDVPPGHKYCPRCKLVRPHPEWHRTKRTRDGYSSQCKFCRVDGARRTYLKRSYGLTPEDVAAMIKQQRGKCAICRKRPAEHVDHDHTTGKVRGVTCFPCNGGLGQFKENVEWLANAIAYLEQHDPQTEENARMATARLQSLGLAEIVQAAQIKGLMARSARAAQRVNAAEPV
jgi:hypothetical protein